MVVAAQAHAYQRRQAHHDPADTLCNTPNEQRGTKDFCLQRPEIGPTAPAGASTHDREQQKSYAPGPITFGESMLEVALTLQGAAVF